jgi:hypothetical protein
MNENNVFGIRVAVFTHGIHIFLSNKLYIHSNVKILSIKNV